MLDQYLTQHQSFLNYDDPLCTVVVLENASILSNYLQMLLLFLTEWKDGAKVFSVMDSKLARISVISKWLGFVHFICCMLTSYHWFHLSQSHFRVALKRSVLLKYCKSGTASESSDLHPKIYKFTFHQIKNTKFSWSGWLQNNSNHV